MDAQPSPQAAGLPSRSCSDPWENDNANRPLGGAPTPSVQGASSDAAKERRTMSIMPSPTANENTPPPNCPVCHEPASHWGRHSGHGVTVANYVCANAHGWLTKWVTP